MLNIWMIHGLVMTKFITKQHHFVSFLFSQTACKSQLCYENENDITFLMAPRINAIFNSVTEIKFMIRQQKLIFV